MKKLLLTVVAVAASTLSISAMAHTGEVLAVKAAEAHTVFHTYVSDQATADEINKVAHRVAPTVVTAKVSATQVRDLINAYKTGAADAVTAYVNSQKAATHLEAKRDVTSTEVSSILAACVGPENDVSCANAFNRVIGA